MAQCIWLSRNSTLLLLMVSFSGLRLCGCPVSRWILPLSPPLSFRALSLFLILCHSQSIVRPPTVYICSVVCINPTFYSSSKATYSFFFSFFKFSLQFLNDVETSNLICSQYFSFKQLNVCFMLYFTKYYWEIFFGTFWGWVYLSFS